jgi:hypothetical protein
MVCPFPAAISIERTVVNIRGYQALAAAVLPWLAFGASAQGTVPAKKLTAAPAQSADPTQEQLVAMRNEKMALEVFKKAPWTFDFDQARAQAKKEGKLIFAYFSRSYAH